MTIEEVVEAALEESRRRASRWIACRPGCSECCHAAFPITIADRDRLRAGLAQCDAEVAAAIGQRAAAYARAIAGTFPGDWQTGLLTADDAWRDWFFEKQKGVACPVLDPASGECLLYAHRPVACRIYGHLIQIGDAPQTRCRLCFEGATEAEMENARVHVAEDAVVDQDGLAAGHTIVALAVL